MKEGDVSVAEFDSYSGNYHDALMKGVRLSGEDPDFFAQGRCQVLQARLSRLAARPSVVLDFGCGTGSTSPHLAALTGVREVIGTDASSGLLDRAIDEHGGDSVSFVPMSERLQDRADLAYCNGVFHHIAPPQRPEALAWIKDALRPGGLFALWENNPWNPGTRLVMSRVAFDRDAVTLSAPAARRLLEANGFSVVGTEFAFIFPRPLRALRPLERRLSRLPIGGQYMVLARAPS